jgi:hypothetical protein
MKKVLVLTLFLLVSMAWAVAQTHDPSAQGQASSPSPTVNDSGQQTSPTPGSAGQATPGMPPSSSQQMPGQTQTAPPSGDQGSAMGNISVTEGCLGGTAPNFTITDKAGKVYKLNIPEGTNTAVLDKHIGESVQVAGQVNGAGTSASASSSGASSSSSGASIDAKKIGRGTGTCPGGAAGSKAPTPPTSK